MKRLTFALILAVSAVLLTSCGKVDRQKVQENYNKMRYTVIITVNIKNAADPKILIRTNDFTFDPAKKEVFIKEGFISHLSLSDSFAIRVEGAKFSVPLGGEIQVLSDHDR